MESRQALLRGSGSAAPRHPRCTRRPTSSSHGWGYTRCCAQSSGSSTAALRTASPRSTWAPSGWRYFSRQNGSTAQPTRPSAPPGWRPVAGAAELDEWNGIHDTLGVLLPGLLERAQFRILVKHEDGAIVGGAVAHLGTGVVSVSNVFAVAPAVLDWTELVRAVGAYFPGRAMVGYERGASLSAALAAGFTAVGKHRVWVR